MFLRVFKVIKLNDEKDSEMVVNRPLVRFPRFLSHPLLSCYLRCVAYSPQVQPAVSASVQFCQLPVRRLPIRRRCRSIPVRPMSRSQPNVWSAVSYSITPPVWPPGAQGRGDTREGGRAVLCVEPPAPSGGSEGLPAVPRSLPSSIEQIWLGFSRLKKN